MARILALAYDTAGIFARYKAIHDEVLGFSVRRALHGLSLHKGAYFRAREHELASLRGELDRIQGSIRGLARQELTQRAGEEVRKALLQYIDALLAAVSQLELMCRGFRLEYDGDGAYAQYSHTEYREDSVAYDDLVQQYKRCGVRLNRLLESF
jgi:hypothetical protein